MIVRQLHRWHLTPGEALVLQEQLAVKISREACTNKIQYIAGVDVKSPVVATGEGTAAVVVLTYPQLEVVETSVAQGQITFPYIPGLLSFRELPLAAQAFTKLTHTPDLVMVDGQGVAHPRRLGIASHLGLLLGIPTIGCAKSCLIGEYDEPPQDSGRYTYLYHGDEVIGAALRSRGGTKPVFVSVGHLISLEQSISWVRMCCRGYRLPEPTRLAHQAANGNIKPEPMVINS